MTQNLFTIVDWDTTGRGIADYERPDGRHVPVAIPGSIVGETVEVESLVKKNKGSIRHVGDISSVVTPSPHRCTPRCSHVIECGGCSWQQINYEYQLSVKQNWVATLFAPLGIHSSFVRPIIGSEKPWQYRNKMEFSFSQDRAGKRFLGLFQRKGRCSVFDLNECFLAHEWMSQALQSVRQWWQASGLAAYRPSSDEGSLQTVTMRDSATFGDRMVILTLSGNPDFAPQQHHLDDFVASLRQVATPETGSLSIVLRIRQIAKKTATQFYEMMLFGPDFIREELEVEAVAGTKRKLEFQISPQAFFQPNTIQSMKIYSQALQMAALESGQVLFDLYCGIGIFGMFASLEVRKAIGVEISRESAYDAKTNADRLKLSNFSIQSGDVATVVATMKKEGSFECPSTVIVDPPRAGLSPMALDEIVSLEPQTLVYVSCNPESQVRDASILMQRGWEIETIQSIDQFPQTFHVENILVLRKGS